MGVEAGKPTSAPTRPRRRPPPQPSSSAGAAGRVSRSPPPSPAPAPRRRRPAPVTLAPNLSPKAPTPVQTLVAPAQRQAKRQVHRALTQAERHITLPQHGREPELQQALAHFGIDSQAKVDALPP